jgi:radical SAM protein with 4Fe4S-binding SPASM domain
MFHEYTLLSPFNISLLEKIKDWSLIVKTNDIDEIDDIVYYFKGSHNLILLQANDVDFHKLSNFRDANITIHTNKVDHISLELSKKIKIFLRSNSKENYARIIELSKNGFHSGIWIDNQWEVKWSELFDLFDFYKENCFPVTPIEPFHHILTTFSNRQFQSYTTVYYNDPGKFLHLDGKGNIAFCLEDLEHKEFIGNIYNVSALDEIKNFKNKYHSYFLERHICAACPAWSICRGSLKNHMATKKCKELFLELIKFKNDMIENKQIALLN